jgi:hypothetical protein
LRLWPPARTFILQLQEYPLNKQKTAEQAAEEVAVRERRSQRIVLDRLLDDEELPEQRWPFMSSRAKVCTM